MRFIVGQQHALSDVGELVETTLQQFFADSLALMLRADEDVLDVDDGHVVAENASEPDEVAVVACGHDERGVGDASLEPFWILGVGTPADGVVQADEFLDVRELVGRVVHASDRNDAGYHRWRAVSAYRRRGRARAIWSGQPPEDVPYLSGRTLVR